MEHLSLRSRLGFKQKRPGYRKPIAEGSGGAEYWRDGEKWIQRDMFIDRLLNRYVENVSDAKTGVVLRQVNEPLKKHIASESARRAERQFNPELFRGGWYLKEIFPEEVPEYAIEALDMGFDGPALRRLAAIQNAEREEVERFISVAFIELGLGEKFSETDAGLVIAKHLAQLVLSGDIHPYTGARLIWKRVYNKVSALQQLLVFIGLASEYEDCEEHRKAYAEDILEACRKLCRPVKST